ncbi:TMEM211 [Branchiostoma lanceolatum]|uniref:TMEM211 protein n=1 Tax=Branchiostoma lanceolatum TaxID=7740 RepID=A0A8J9WDE0_BRALA|nr:TMEM211 [Branchiostoma lanceolatum]
MEGTGDADKSISQSGQDDDGLPQGRDQQGVCTCALVLWDVVICSVGLIIYPVGLESNVIKMYCGQSAASFNPGNCEIGWGYVLAIMGTALTMFGPFLSKYAIDKQRLEDSEEFV